MTTLNGNFDNPNSNDPLFTYLRKNSEAVPQAPSREREILLGKARSLIADRKAAKRKSWIFLAIPALAATSLVLVLWKGKPRLTPPPMSSTASAPSQAEVEQFLYEAFQYELSEDNTEDFGF